MPAGRRDSTSDPQKTVSVDQIRTLQQAIATVDLSSIRPALIELITRLRGIGIPISDRRAVRLQRIIAASAILASRTTASDE